METYFPKPNVPRVSEPVHRDIRAKVALWEYAHKTDNTWRCAERRDWYFYFDLVQIQWKPTWWYFSDTIHMRHM